MGFAQWVVRRILPGSWSKRIEAESRSWLLRCECGWEKSVWEAGGVRYAAAPARRAVVGRCSSCRGTRMLIVERRPRREPVLLRK